MESELVCPRYHRAVELIGRRWTGAILSLMLQGKSRFHELSHSIPEMSDKMLSERLKELESEGIVLRTVTADTPVKVEYTLTEKGHALEKVVSEMTTWAQKWIELEGDEQAETLKAV